MKKLTPEQVKYYSTRLIHFLKGVRRRNGYSQENVAHMIDYSLSHYRRLETEGYADEGKFINALDLLSVLGSLENMSLHEFLLYLENPDTLEIEEFLGKINTPDSSQEKRQLFPWEKFLLVVFNKVDMDTRLEFTERFMADKNNAESLTRGLKIALLLDEVLLKKLNPFNLKLFDNLLEYILVQLKNKSEHRLSNAKLLLRKLFS